MQQIICFLFQRYIYLLYKRDKLNKNRKAIKEGGERERERVASKPWVWPLCVVGLLGHKSDAAAKFSRGERDEIAQ